MEEENKVKKLPLLRLNSNSSSKRSKISSQANLTPSKPVNHIKHLVLNSQKKLPSKLRLGIEKRPSVLFTEKVNKIRAVCSGNFNLSPKKIGKKNRNNKKNNDFGIPNFHTSNLELENKSKIQLLNAIEYSGVKQRYLPKVKNTSEINQFIINRYKSDKEAKVYIDSLATKLQVAENYERVKKTKLNEHYQEMELKLEAAKKCNNLNFGGIEAYTEPNLEKDIAERTEREKKEEKPVDLEVVLKDLQKKRTIFKRRSSKFRLSTKEGTLLKRLEELKNKTDFENGSHNFQKLRAKNFANCIFHMNPPDADYEPNNTQDIVIKPNGLEHIIKLKRILNNKNKDINANEDSDEYIDEVLLKNQAQYEEDIARLFNTAKNNFTPAFIRNRFNIKTDERFKGVNGQYFGVCC